MSNVNGDTINILRQVCDMLVGAASSPSNVSRSVATNSTSQENVSQQNITNPVVQNLATPRLPGTNTAQMTTSRENQSGQSNAVDDRRLFSRQSRILPYGGRAASQPRSRRTTTKKEKSITRTMFCFADKNQANAPSCSEKLELLENGLGEKRIPFPSSATSSIVKELLYETYPGLRHTGGFQLLLSKEKARKELTVVSHGCVGTEQIRCFGTGRIYIRPLQRGIPITQRIAVKEEFEECLSCNFSVPVSQMREHRYSCTGFSRSSGDEDDINETDGRGPVVVGRQKRFDCIG